MRRHKRELIRQFKNNDHDMEHITGVKIRYYIKEKDLKTKHINIFKKQLSEWIMQA